jgi:hypothetical protein
MCSILYAQTVCAFEVFGVKLGEENTVTRCQKKSQYEIINNPKQTCFEETQYWSALRLSENDRPSYINGDIELVVVDNKIEGLRFAIFPDLFKDVHDAFVIKFGKPSSFTENSVTNSFGASFDNPVALWKTEAVEVSLGKRGRKGRITEGEAIIETRKAANMHDQERQIEKNKGLKL